MILSFFAALCFAFADSATSMLFQSGDSVRIKREVGSPQPHIFDVVEENSNTQEPLYDCPYESPNLGMYYYYTID